MGFPRRLLDDDEDLVVDTHPHGKALVVPALAVVVVAGLTAYGLGATPGGTWQPRERWGELAAAVLVLLVVSVLPWLRWRTTHLVITSRRVVTRSGVLSRTTREIPLVRVNDVMLSHGIVERLLGCGDIVISSGSEHGQLLLGDVPHVEDVQRRLSDLVGGANHGWREPGG